MSVSGDWEAIFREVLHSLPCFLNYCLGIHFWLLF